MAAPPKPKQGGLVHGIFRIVVKVHNTIYRLSGGSLGGTMQGAPILLLTTTGGKTGKKRTLPLIYLRTDKGYALVASYAGADKDPAWYSNLVANPECAIRVGRKSFAVHAETVSEDRHAQLWPKLVEIYADYALYQKRTNRSIPVVELIPKS